MTPQDTKAAKGLYTVKENTSDGLFTVEGPTFSSSTFHRREPAELLCAELNAAWLAGRASGPTVDQIIDVFHGWSTANHSGWSGDAKQQDLRDRLTKLIEGK